MTRAASATGRAFFESLRGRDFDSELLAQRLAEERRWPDDHKENEVVLFRIVVARMAAHA
jgi:hypothetical protein